MRHVWVRSILALIWLAAAVVSGLSGNIEMTLIYVIIGGVFLYFAYTTWRKKGE